MRTCNANICRVCLLKKDMTLPLSTNLNKISLTEKINACATVNILTEDSYPQNICLNCFKNLNIAYDFVELCKKSEQRLREFSNDDQIKRDVLNDTEIVEQFLNSEFTTVDLGGDKSFHKVLNDTDSRLNVTDTSNTNNLLERILQFKDVTLKSFNGNLRYSKNGVLPEIIVNYDRKFLIEEFPFNNEVKNIKNGKANDSGGEGAVKIENSFNSDFNHSCDSPFDDIDCENLKEDGNSKIQTVGQGFIINYDRKYLENKIITNKKIKKNRTKKFKQKVQRNYEQLMCPVCGKMLRSNMKRHIEVFHKGNRPFTCKICQKTFKDKAYLLDHENQHTGNKKYLCTLCGMAFIQASGYRQHLKSHPEISSNKCTLCSKAFRTPGLLEDHMNIHTGDRKYNCKICQERFYTKATLRRHSIIHKERKHKCDLCKKLFHGQHDLRRHMLVHTGVKSFQCDICASKFTQKHDMKKHIMRHFRSTNNSTINHIKSTIYSSTLTTNHSYT